MKLRTGIGLAALVLSSAAFGAFDAVTVKYGGKVGDVHKYKQVGKFDIGGMEIEFTALQTKTLDKIDAKGNFISSDKTSEMKLNGQDAPDGAGGGASTSTVSPKGELIKLEGERIDDSAYRMANLDTFVIPDKPINPGDTWSYDVKADKTTGAVDAKITYTFIAEEKVGSVDTLKIKTVSKEKGDSGASIEATLWIAKEDSLMVKYTAKWTNVPITGVGPISGDVSLTLVQDK